MALDHSNTGSNLLRAVKFEFFPLSPLSNADRTDDAEVMYRPSGALDMNDGGVITISVAADEKWSFGLKLINNSKVDIYPYVLYLGNDSFSIGTLVCFHQSH